MTDVLHAEQQLGFYDKRESGRDDTHVRAQPEASARFLIMLKRTLGAPADTVIFPLYSSRLQGKENALLKISSGKWDQCPGSQHQDLRHKLLSLPRMPGAKVPTPGRPNSFKGWTVTSRYCSRWSSSDNDFHSAKFISDYRALLGSFSLWDP